jgi:stearoyl-CoA desaturase (delta-9 desaturase)
MRNTVFARPGRFLRGYSFGAVIPFFLLHLAVFGVFFQPFQWKVIGLLIATYAVRMFAVTAGYHRYFSHRSYKMNRVCQFLMAVLAQTSAQKGVLWWAAHHRDHHRNSDNEGDVHSPWQSGFWWSHVGWVISNNYDNYDPRLIQDFGKFPELRWLDRYHWVPTTIFAVLIFFVGGWGAFFWGYVVSTVLLFHCTFSINSLAHIWGTRRFDTADQSRNNFLLALITFGEGWHNNHHKFMHSCRQGMRWWEIDFTYYVLKIMSWIGLARELRGFRLAYQSKIIPQENSPELMHS